MFRCSSLSTRCIALAYLFTRLVTLVRLPWRENHWTLHPQEKKRRGPKWEEDANQLPSSKQMLYFFSNSNWWPMQVRYEKKRRFFKVRLARIRTDQVKVGCSPPPPPPPPPLPNSVMQMGISCGICFHTDHSFLVKALGAVSRRLMVNQ